MSPPLLTLRDVDAHWPGAGGNQSSGLRDIRLSLAPGERVTLLGANGAGKSTLLQMIMGLLRPTAGSVELNGLDISRDTVARRARHGIGFVPQSRRLFPGLTVDETLTAAGPANRRQRRRRRDSMLALLPALAERLHTTAWRLSGGEQQMLALARALMMQPALLLLDEPSIGLARGVAASLYERVASLADTGMAVLVAEQNVTAALAFAPRAIVMAGGRIVADEASRDLARADRLASLLLRGGT